MRSERYERAWLLNGLKVREHRKGNEHRIRQEASVNHEVSEICGQVWQNDRSDGHQNLEFLKFADHIYLGLISTGQNESAEES